MEDQVWRLWAKVAIVKPDNVFSIHAFILVVRLTDYIPGELLQESIDCSQPLKLASILWWPNLSNPLSNILIASILCLRSLWGGQNAYRRRHNCNVFDNIYIGDLNDIVHNNIYIDIVDHCELLDDNSCDICGCVNCSSRNDEVASTGWETSTTSTSTPNTAICRETTQGWINCELDVDIAEGTPGTLVSEICKAWAISDIEESVKSVFCAIKQRDARWLVCCTANCASRDATQQGTAFSPRGACCQMHPFNILEVSLWLRHAWMMLYAVAWELVQRGRYRTFHAELIFR